MPEPRAFRVRRGRLLAYRLFDVGDAIDLDRAGRAIAGSTRLARARLAREGSEALVIASPPLDIALGAQELPLGRGGPTSPTGSPAPPGSLRSPGHLVEAHLTARLYDYGTASLRFEIEIAPGTELLALLPLVDELYDSARLEAAARAALDALRPRLGPAILDGHSGYGAETYTVVFVEEIEGRPSARELLEEGGLDRLLLGETASERLAPSQREDVLRASLSYLEDDLAVIDWNSAFVLEPSGSRDIPDLLEFATSQLLELRCYDAVLDNELTRTYGEVARARQNPATVLWSPYGRLARQVLKRYLELTEFTERVDNALKVIGDFYLARVYQAAVGRFRTAAWRDSVYRKQELLARVYDLLQGEVAARRSVLLETAIVLLIVLELVIAALQLR